jgi:Asp-tRNA(Asn)/Glu-tRNA(Gln) amidotransferase A subunit family amidase
LTAGHVIGLDLATDEAELMLGDVLQHRNAFRRMHGRPLANDVPPALTFSPLLPGIEARPDAIETVPIAFPQVERPADLATLVYADLPTLAALVRSRKVSCVELCETYLARLKEVDASLLCIVTLLPERARAQAEALDRELAEGTWRGPLHGIPWGAKDLLAVAGAPTTWGSTIYAEQTFDEDATVVRRLDAAGAVLIAKLSLGELAWGDVWFRGMTRNPWNRDKGSSGSSAGSAAAVAAGGVAFSIGSETLGSIVSPSTRCGNSSLRPTFGRVSRHGSMALSWSMDKLGVLARSAQDAALVFDVIQGPDGLDGTVHDMPFEPSGPVDVSGWRVGYTKGAFERAGENEQAVLKTLDALGVELVEFEAPRAVPVAGLLTILSVEAAAAFDHLTRSGRDDEMVRQEERAWPNVFRAAQFIPAVEYVRANRLRTELMHAMNAQLEGLDAVVHPPFADGILSISNLTGHPCFVAPCGFESNGMPESISFTGLLFGETKLLALVEAWQVATEHHTRHPDL